ncbi:solute carrier family 22 member 1-like [Pectinophora gossypiella]|uniref:solute carrier family 22 member 1-like n=1 Tax=Pectinophora gossypiella TaxID=13191 RepID=UPI00214F39FB|nr:solute carrier family 22 member 1-like [Pectinophora gossypiella]
MAELNGNKCTHVDDVLIKFNIFGRYYAKSIVLIFIAYMSNILYSENYVFTVEEVKYKCKDVRFENNTCSTLTDSTEVCTEWLYENPDSFVAEFQLACQDWKRTLVGTVHSFGYMVGLLIVGPLSDRLGRKSLVVVTGVLGGVIGIIRSFTGYYWLFVALEFLEATVGDISSPAFMLSIEMVAKKKLVMVQFICNYGYICGTFALSLSAWLFPYWRSLLRAMYTPALLFFLYIFFLDESPRWLLSKGKKDKAVRILETAATKNKIKLDKDMLGNLAYEEDKGMSYTNLLKMTFSSKALLKRFILCLIWWTTSTFVNFGMNINSVLLQGNKYINFALTAAVCIPGNVLILYFLTKYKRKYTLFWSFIASAAFCLVQPFVPTGLPWLSVTLFMAGKFMSSVYFDTTYIFTSEIFPTYTRNSMHALCSSLGRVGSILAPQTPLLMAYWHGLPSLVFGLASLLAGMATLFAPDTADDALPDNVTQAEALGRHVPTKTDINKFPTLNNTQEQVISHENNISQL